MIHANVRMVGTTVTGTCVESRVFEKKWLVFEALDTLLRNWRNKIGSNDEP